MQRCQVCVHENVTEINKKILKGANLAQLSLKYGVSTSSMYNHAREHISRQALKGAEIVEKNAGRDVLNELDNLIKETQDILKDARTNGHNTLALKAIGQLRGNVTLLAQIQNEIFKQQATNEISPEELQEFRLWKKQKDSLGMQVRNLSVEDQELLADAAMLKIERMNSMQPNEEEEDPVPGMKRTRPTIYK